MKIGGNLTGFNISAKGLSIQRKKMNLIAENIANADITRTENGEPYQRKTLSIKQNQSPFRETLSLENSNVSLQKTDKDHLSGGFSQQLNEDDSNGLTYIENKDQTPGDLVYMPNSPDADEKGYVQTSNVNVVNEMVDMIAASRSYEANLTAFNSSKQIAKDSLEI